MPAEILRTSFWTVIHSQGRRSEVLSQSLAALMPSMIRKLHETAVNLSDIHSSKERE